MTAGEYGRCHHSPASNHLHPHVPYAPLKFVYAWERSCTGGIIFCATRNCSIDCHVALSLYPNPCWPLPCQIGIVACKTGIALVASRFGTYPLLICTAPDGSAITAFRPLIVACTKFSTICDWPCSVSTVVMIPLETSG